MTVYQRYTVNFYCRFSCMKIVNFCKEKSVTSLEKLQLKINKFQKEKHRYLSVIVYQARLYTGTIWELNMPLNIWSPLKYRILATPVKVKFSFFRNQLLWKCPLSSENTTLFSHIISPTNVSVFSFKNHLIFIYLSYSS